MQGTKEVIGGHVETELAEEIRRLAREGNRSVSREVAAALRAHVEREAPASAAGRKVRSGRVDPVEAA